MAKFRNQKRLELCSRIQKEFGDRFRDARVKGGKLQKNVAAEMGLTRTTISNIERGVQRLYLDQLYEAAQILGVALDALLPPIAAVIHAPSILTSSDSPLPAAAADEVERLVSKYFDVSQRQPQSRRSTNRTAR